MWTTIFCMAITAAIIIFHYEIIKPKEQAKSYSIPQCWIDFVTVNIDSCRTTAQCHQCRNLIELFDNRLRNKMPKEVFMKELHNMYHRLDIRYKALKNEEKEFALAV